MVAVSRLSSQQQQQRATAVAVDVDVVIVVMGRVLGKDVMKEEVLKAMEGVVVEGLVLLLLVVVERMEEEEEEGKRSMFK